MAGTVPRSVSLYKAMGATSSETLSGLEASTQTFLQGAPLFINTSGYLAVATAEISLTNAVPIVGFAAEDAHNITQGTQLIRYYPALPNYVFEATLENDSTNAYAWLVTSIGETFALMADVTNHRWFVDQSVTANGQCRIIGSRDAVVADLKPRVQFIILAAGSQLMT